MIRIPDLGRQNISETKWLKESYEVHQKGRSDKGEDDYSLSQAGTFCIQWQRGFSYEGDPNSF